MSDRQKLYSLKDKIEHDHYILEQEISKKDIDTFERLLLKLFPKDSGSIFYNECFSLLANLKNNIPREIHHLRHMAEKIDKLIALEIEHNTPKNEIYDYDYLLELYQMILAAVEEREFELGKTYSKYKDRINRKISGVVCAKITFESE